MPLELPGNFKTKQHKKAKQMHWEKENKESCLGLAEQEVDCADLTGFSTFRLYSCKHVYQMTVR